MMNTQKRSLNLESEKYLAKVALITDTHLGIRNDLPAVIDNTIKSFDWFFENLKQDGIRHIVHLGDLYDRRKYINYVTAYQCRKHFLERCNEENIETHIICGNHDEFYKNTHEVNSLRELVGNRYSNIKIYSTPSTIEIDGLEFLLLPWITESNHDVSMKAIENSTAPIVLGHLELKGFEMDRGSFCEHGMDAKIFERFYAVYSGHFHHRSSKGNLFYLGAFSEFTWADFNDPRGFSTIDTKTREVRFLENPNKLFTMILYDDVKNPNILDTIAATDYNFCHNNFVRIVCMNRTNPYAFDMLMEKIYKTGPIDISVVEEMISLNSSADDSDDPTGVEDTPRILDSYISNLTLPVDTDSMKSFMQKIYSEAIMSEYV